MPPVCIFGKLVTFITDGDVAPLGYIILTLLSYSLVMAAYLRISELFIIFGLY